MATTIPELVETSDPPLSTDSDAQFDAKAFPWAASLDPFGQSVSAIAIAARDNAEEALAAALGGDLPPLTGFGGEFLRVKSDESGAEFFDLGAVPDIAGLTFSAGDILYHDGTNLVNLGAGTEGQVLTQGASVPEWGAGNQVKAWVNFDGTGTVSIRESFNVSSITDNGTGDYTINFATALVDSNYVVLGQNIDNNNNSSALFANVRYASDLLTSSVRIRTGFVVSNSDGFADREQVHVSIIR